MPKTLTDTVVRNIQPPERGQITVIDGSLKNFGCRVSQGGTKSWVVMLGKGRRQTLGTYPTLTLSDARTEAKRILAEKTLGRIKPQRAAFEDCRKEYLADCKSRLKAGTLKLYTYHLTAFYPFGRQAIADITPRQIITELNKLTPSMKEHTSRIGRTFFKWAFDNHYIDTSPMARIRPVAKGRSRERVLTEDELKAVLRAAQRTPWPYGPIVELLVHTGQRRGEIGGLQWSWIDFDEKTLLLPPSITKNKLPHFTPLSETTLNVLRALPHLSDIYVFPAARERRKGQPATSFNGWSKAKATFDRECGFGNWVLHDTRRTLSTMWAAPPMSVSQTVVDRYLNHISAGNPVSKIYNRYTFFAEMKDAITKWEKHLANLRHP